MQKKGDSYFPTKEFKKRAWVKSKRIYQEANKDPIKFWEEAAKELYWFKKWKKVFEQKPPYFHWFLGGKINITYNALDRNLEKKKNKVALIWEPEPLNEREVKLTYYELHRKVNKFANALKKLGVKKGDVVGVYMPMIPETIIAMLACARIGAIHSVVFSAFSPQALRIRLQDTGAKLLITCDGYYRRGKLIDLKKSADEGIKETKVKKVVVVRRAGNEINFKKGRDYIWEDLIKNEKDYCEPAKMDAEDPLFILYTSGCCHKDTLIQLENGEIKKISDLVEKGGSNVINVDFKELKQDIDPITNKYRYFWPFELWKIQTPLSTIKVTPNHPFFVLQNDGQIVEKQAKDLKVGDHILQTTKISVKTSKQRLPHPKIQYQKEKCTLSHSSNTPILPKFLTPNFAQILGYLIGDGNLTDTSVVATDKDEKNLLFYKNLFEKELKVRAQIKIAERKRLIINSAYLARYLKEVFPEIFLHSYEKRVPKRIQVSPNKCVAAFIRGFFDAEGSVTGGRVKITSQSRELIQTIQLLLLRFGIITNYFEEERKVHFGKKYHYKILVPGLTITDRKSLEEFNKEIGFSSLAKKKKLEELLKRLKGKKKRSMIYQIPINEIARTLRKTIMLPKKESRQIHLDSYIYSNRRIKKERLPEIRNYLQRKINLLRSLNLSWKKKLNPTIRNQIKMAIRLLKVSQKEIAEISGKRPETVHQYLNAKKPHVSEKTLNKFYKSLLPYLLKLKKEKLKILQDLQERIKKLEKLENVGFFEIKKITKEKNDSDFVYDLTALNHHNYIANSFVVHNSTGKPKGIVHVCGGYTVQAYLTAKLIFDLWDDDVFWSTADLGWITGHTYSCYGPLLNGTTFLIFEGVPDYPKPNRWCEIIEKYGVTTFYTAPTAIRMLEKEMGKVRERLDTLQIIASVGEPINEEAWEWYFKNVGKGKCPLLDTWWQTETGGILITSLPGIGPFKPTFAGLPFPGVKTAILDEKGKKVKRGEKGNLVILPPFTPGMLRGVYKNPEKYRKTYFGIYGDKVYFTSDMAYQDEKGLIRIVGRADDVIKVAGHRISTGEMENIITKDERIAECAVVGVPHEIKGEVPIVFAVLKSKEKVKEEEVVKLVVDGIGKIAKPQKVYFVSDLPKTRSGKIMRRILKRLFTREPLGDLSTLANPESVEEAKKVIGK